MNDNRENFGKKVIKSNRFPRKDEQAQSIKKMFELNVKRFNKIQFLRNILDKLKNLP